MKQVLAVVAAGLLVALAIAVRAVIDDDGDGTPADDADDDGDLVIACVQELRDACERLGGEVRIEDPADTIAGVAAGEIDAWITFDPWPAIADLEEAPLGPAVAVAATDLVLLVRDSALAPACANAPDWACVAAITGSSAPALPSDETALGALLLGHAALGWSQATRPGEPFAANEFDLPEFAAWGRALRFTRDPVLDMLQLGAAGPAAAGTTLADYERVVEGSPRATGLTVTDTPVPATVAVVVAGRGAERIAGDDDLRDGLEALGYDLADDAATTGLPNAGVLFALTQEL